MNSLGATTAVLDFYGCPADSVDLRAQSDPDSEQGFFKFGEGCICFGSALAGRGATTATGALYDALPDARLDQGACLLPFDPAPVIENLRRERYTGYVDGDGLSRRRWVRGAYYLVRPALPVSVRRILQRASLRGWDRIAFPSWPVDTTVERLLERLLCLAMAARGVDRLPFIWFWPEGRSSCMIMTHDVETKAGLRFCPRLMDLNDSFGIKSSFQLVPESRYRIPADLLNELRERGFEINIHDFNHDGHLFREKSEFLRRSREINRYAAEYGAHGFRAGVMYRNAGWYGAFAFSYDMSVPNVAHLDPQRGGCCTVFPYFIGNILELPLTTTQDYPLFHVLGDYSIELWKRQIHLIQEKHGLISFIVHPDYVISARARRTYQSLLEYLSRLSEAQNVWKPLPGEVDAWWRERSQMELIEEGGRWVIKGRGSERARIAFANREADGLVYQVCDGASAPHMV